MLTIVLVLLAVPLVLALVGWIGLRFKPDPFPPYPQSREALTTVPIPEGLPAPVDRHLRTVASGSELPVTESAVLSGPARLRIMGITFNSRARFIQAGGRGYRHYIESTIFGYPLFKANEIVLDGTGRMELPFGVSEGPEIDQAGNLSLWGEQFAWMPSAVISDPRFRWEEVDDTSARWFVPLGTGEDEFLVRFDPETGLMLSMEAMRYKQEGGEKVHWTVRVEQWGTFHGLMIPTRLTLTWADEDSPWAVFTIDDVAYNVDVSETITANGP